MLVLTLILSVLIAGICVTVDVDVFNIIYFWLIR